MLALGIDTSSPIGSVGLAGEQGLIAELSLMTRATHSERLLSSVSATLLVAGEALKAVTVFAVTSGPGSFTGLRIGIATAKGLALGSGRPLVGFSTLETIALACQPWLPRDGGGPVCVLLDAGRGEVYRGLFNVSGGTAKRLAPEAAMAPAEATERLPAGSLVCGSGVAACRRELEARLPAAALVVEEAPSIGATLARRALALAAERGLSDLPALIPNYLRLSDAEIGFKG